jgi:hypothetical protein
MTISSSTRRAGPYDCDGVDTTFNFAFKVFSASDVKVTLTSPAGVENVISSYSVTLNPDQDATPGGFITTVAIYGVGNKITISGASVETQETAIPNAGGFFPKVIEAALDKLTILVQQLREELGRSIKLPVSSAFSNLSLPEPSSARFLRWNLSGTALENADITGAGSIGIPVSIAQGGTGETTLSAARAALGISLAGVGAAIVNKNRFANGGFVFDQRNNGSAVSVPGATEVRALDCLAASGTAAAGAYSVQRLGSSGLAGAPNYVRCLVTTNDPSMAATDVYQVSALIEGVDVADLRFGDPTLARPVSLSFWFRSSITGTFSGSLRNSATNRGYVYSWAYPVAGVWQEVKVENIPGDTTGTWVADNNRSIMVSFSLGVGSNFTAAAGAWGAGNRIGVTGGVNLISTNGATMDIALLQVEAGPVCTPFEWVPHQAGLARVRRYFRTYRAASNDGIAFAWGGNALSGVAHWSVVHLDPPMRATPTTDLSAATFTFANLGSPIVAGNSSTAVVVQYTGTASGAGTAVLTGGQITVSVEL